jgi:DNA primase
VREAANIAEIASEFTALRRQGARFVGLCPFPDHTEKTPSFSVSPDRGFYYCFGCLEANERIWTSKGLIPIAAAEPGEEVIGLDGNRETITDRWFKSAPTLRIRTGAATEGIELTPDHWCVFVRQNEALLRTIESTPRLSAAHASEVREGDLWLYPVISEINRHTTPLSGEHATGWPSERIAQLPVNCNTAWLYGLWLAEGSLHKGGVRWSFAANEAKSLAKRVAVVLEEEFGSSSTRVVVRPEKNTREVICSSPDLAVLFGYWFGGEIKRLPFEALNWKAECQAALIEGYLGTATSATTFSEELAYGIFALCVQSGRLCSVSSIPSRTKKIYCIHIHSSESPKGFFATLDGTQYFCSVVQEIEASSQEPATVVDISTTGSHTFLTKIGITHNCQRGGDAIKLVSELKSLSFADTVSYLAERSGVELEFEGGADSEAARERRLRRRNIHKALAAAAVYYHKYLLMSSTAEAERARQYLKSRKLELSTIEEFRLGYAPPRSVSGFARAVRKLGIDREVLAAAGLLSSRGGERFSGRITFPISDRRGRIVGFGARALGDAQPKYLNSPETEIFNKRDLLYGFPQVSEAIRRERAVIIVEGYTDVLMLYQRGIKNAVATLGTATTPSHLRILSGYADKFYVLFDPDTAGEKALERADATVRALERADDPDTVATATKLKLDLRVLRLPQDPADWLPEHSPEEFREMLSGALTLLEYIFRRKAERARGAGTAERSRMLPEIRDLIRRIDDPVFYRDALRIAAETLGVSPRELESGRKEQERFTHSPSRPAKSPLEHASQEVLALILAHPQLTVRPLEQGVEASPLPRPFTLHATDFADESHSSLFRLLQQHPGEDLDSILTDERAKDLMDRLVALDAEAQELRRKDLYSSDASVHMAWLRLGILSRERAKRLTYNMDEKEALHAEIQTLKEALSSFPTEP